VKSLEQLFIRRPRILNQLHRIHLVGPMSQTNDKELSALAAYALGKTRALEIGTHQGMSAVCIAKALAPGGILFCVDPWPEANFKVNPCWLICERHFRRSGVSSRIKVLRTVISHVRDQLPTNLDFVFIDGDHSRKGIETDWKIVAPQVARDGIVCLHDVVTPATERWRRLDAVLYYNDVISRDDSFETIETVHSMAILRKH
jgi:predicted O-methyltransferase YrrM